MAGSINKAILLGHLGRDPDVHISKSGSRVASFSVATSKRWKDKETGEQKEITHWHRIVVFNDSLIGVVERFLKKGMKVYIEGEMETRKWTDDQGQEKTTTEVVLRQYHGDIQILEKFGNGDYPPPADSPDQYGQAKTSSDDSGGSYKAARDGRYMPPMDDMDDDIPF